jgi:transposase-like protein
LNIFKFTSTSATARNNKNSPTTSEYWLSKLFLLLEDYQNDLVLEDIVYFDETYYSEVKGKVTVTEDGKKKRGLSKNKFCIAVGVDATRVCCFVCGKGKPSKNRIYDNFKDKIKKESLMIHDGENAYSKIVDKLELKEEIHLSSETKELSDKDNPMDRINHIHFLLKEFLDSHSGFNRDELQNYLNLFCFIMNPPVDPLEKVEIIMNFAFQKRKKLKYRQKFPTR